MRAKNSRVRHRRQHAVHSTAVAEDYSQRANLEKGWVIANHILVSFHVAFISSVLCLSSEAITKTEVLKFIFVSGETLVSLVFLWFTFHTGVAIHEIGHYLAAVRLNTLNEKLLPEAQAQLAKPLKERWPWLLKMYVLIPYGKFPGVQKAGLNYYPDAPFNLAVAAAGPRISRNMGMIFVPLAILFLFVGLATDLLPIIYIGRIFLGLGAIGTLDFFMADPGKYKLFTEREKAAAKRAAGAQAKAAQSAWVTECPKVKTKMHNTRMQEVTLHDGTLIRAPWQYRNCGMGGRHTEKEYPESNISMQESMFIPLSAATYEESQEMTVALQNRLKEIIENAEGCRVMGIGLEGGLAPYVTKDPADKVPEQRLWRMARQAIVDCGYAPGIDVAIALDPAAAELENAYREEMQQPDAVGMYLFWRDKEKVVMSRDEVFDLYRGMMDQHDVPIVSIEDGFGETDDAGWAMLMEKLGDRIFIIGDDQVTTRDSSIEYAADHNLNNTFLCKANQIGTLCETMLAILVAVGKGLDVVVSHRSKSPNDDMEAQIALASFAMGLKAGGGANTERLFKYGSIIKIMAQAVKEAKQKVETLSKDGQAAEKLAEDLVSRLEITSVMGWEEATNAGIPTVGIRVSFGIKGSERFKNFFTFTGSTPLGTSAGTGEAIHLVDSVIYRTQIPKDEYMALFSQNDDGSYKFRKDATPEKIAGYNDKALSELYRRAQRYGGKGCLNAADHVNTTLAKAFEGQKVADLQGIVDIDQRLLKAEFNMAVERKQITAKASREERIEIMQRKGNLGMNAILSQSLSLARLVAHMQGRELWMVLRETLVTTMAKTIAANGGLDRLSDELKAKVKVEGDLAEVLASQLTYFELAEGLRAVNGSKSAEVKLYDLLRAQLPVYEG
ncbi:MAG TPA: hypothetical protein PLO37_13275 [Candidatus Hydrogenedentes bacterium]|nr:hypothetical protein [Candidatus Hydrogenedentota bacterium]HPG67814.1 hypothetical protein [Candidatus Hydrogenedentota bacterium]